jgi:hypothetical protein
MLQRFRNSPHVPASINVPFHVIVTPLRRKASKSILGVWFISILRISLGIETGAYLLSDLGTNIGHYVLKLPQEAG